MAEKSDRYSVLISEIFHKYHKQGIRSFGFRRAELETAAERLGVTLPKNLGDLIYSFRYRQPLPDDILTTAPPGEEWIIEAAGIGKYRFALSKINRIVPRQGLLAIKVPNATPEIISRYALTDEQSLLAGLRYNRSSICSWEL
jgi:hypothetical protein